MDLKINHELIPLKEVIYDGIQEQSVELDYILPDYFPDIFKLIKCETVPNVTSYSVSDDKVVYELCVDVNILYCTQNSSQLNTIRQKLTYSKTLEFGRTGSGVYAVLKAKTDYVNCRVVNQRRIDIRGAVTVKINATAEKNQEMICDLFGMNVQMKKKPVEYAPGRLTCGKLITVSEELEMNSVSHPVRNVIRSQAETGKTDIKVIANKLIAKGNADVSVLYTCDDSDNAVVDSLKFGIPFSQILDIDGIDETYKCSISTNVVSCDISPVADKDGNMIKLQCELGIWISCSAMRTAHAELVTDVYSTKFPCTFTKSKFKISQVPEDVNAQLYAKNSIECNEGTIDKVFDMWCTPGNAAVRIDENEKAVFVNGIVHYCVLIRNETGMPAIIEKDGAFEQRIDLPDIHSGSTFEAQVEIHGCSYNLSSSNTVQISADIDICGKLYRSSEIEAVTAVEINDEEMKPLDPCCDCAIKLYFGTEGESVWDIAKKYSTSVKSVMEENDLYEEKLTEDKMLLIPIVI
ncbi:MAG: DUF3794 domain-containing protein [Oscillospiraceae bacterium]|nr:DUF3794 domain-containing protein [Oscillospiraceae bacterium]